jgi:uridylate kinase
MINNMTKETIIISLGGSLVAPNEIDIGFLKSFGHCLQKYLNERRFFVYVGGGKPARLYQKALLEFGADDSDRDWIGINVSRLNAEVVKQLFVKDSYSKVITDPSKRITTRKDILVAAGWKPGWSTDYCSVIMAKNSGLKTIINLTNIDYVYDKDPRKFPGAKQIEKISWKDFRKIVGDKWTPGLSMPFDPRASKIAEILKIKVVIINGKNLERLEDFLNNKPFIGTIIQ